MPDWTSLSARASKASHQLIGWVYWDPDAIAAYAALGVADGTDVRDRAVGAGLRREAPEMCDGLAALAAPLWAAVESLPSSGRVLFAAHRQWPRPDDELVSAWLALNCIREWRGDTHFAVLLAEGLSGTQAGLLHDAYMRYPGEWIPRSRGADDAAIATALADLARRGLATAGRVDAAGIALRERIETTTDRLCEQPWRTLGEADTVRVLELIEPVGTRFMARVDATAGPEWMPAARDRRT